MVYSIRNLTSKTLKEKAPVLSGPNERQVLQNAFIIEQAKSFVSGSVQTCQKADVRERCGELCHPWCMSAWIKCCGCSRKLQRRLKVRMRCGCSSSQECLDADAASSRFSGSWRPTSVQTFQPTQLSISGSCSAKLLRLCSMASLCGANKVDSARCREGRLGSVPFCDLEIA